MKYENMEQAYFKERPNRFIAQVKIDGEIRSLDEDIELEKNKKHDISIIVDRVIIKEDITKRFSDTLQNGGINNVNENRNKVAADQNAIDIQTTNNTNASATQSTNNTNAIATQNTNNTNAIATPIKTGTYIGVEDAM